MYYIRARDANLPVQDANSDCSGKFRCRIADVREWQQGVIGLVGGQPR
jgi:hypothetical protein